MADAYPGSNLHFDFLETQYPTPILEMHLEKSKNNTKNYIYRNVAHGRIRNLAYQKEYRTKILLPVHLTLCRILYSYIWWGFFYADRSPTLFHDYFIHSLVRKSENMTVYDKIKSQGGRLPCLSKKQ
jgi:hypothetical protein